MSVSNPVQMTVAGIREKFGGVEKMNGQLLRFACTGNVAALELAAHANADLGVKDNAGNGLAHIAALWGQEKVLCFLKGHGSDLAAKNYQDKTPEDLAREAGNTATAEYLVRAVQRQQDSLVVVSQDDLTKVFGQTAASPVDKPVAALRPVHATVARPA